MPSPWQPLSGLFCLKLLRYVAILLVATACSSHVMALPNPRLPSPALDGDDNTLDAGSAAVALSFKPPNLNPTQIPTAYVAEWGNYFLSSSLYAYSQSNRASIGVVDGSLNLGFGLGSSRRSVALELDFNLESLADRGHGGSLDLRLGRQLIGSNDFALHLGAGWLGVASYGSWPQPGGSPYGILTAAWPLRPHNGPFRQTMQVNLGGGGGRFQRIDSVNLISNGAIASVGVELTPNLGVSAGWAGRGLNASISYVPLPSTPLYLTLSGANISGVDGGGRAVAFSLSWGGSFRTASFP
jgi:hypothetical protein